jgi:hypothetical protein
LNPVPMTRVREVFESVPDMGGGLDAVYALGMADALTSPRIAAHQADLLDAIADVVEARPNWLAGRITTPALALADAILTAAGRQP